MPSRFLQSLGVGDASDDNRGRRARASQSRRSHPSSSRHESDKEKMKLSLRSSKSRGTKTGSERESRSRKSTLVASSGKKRAVKARKEGLSKHGKKRAGTGHSSSEDDKKKDEEPKEKAAYSEASIGAFPVTPSVSSISLCQRRRSTLTQEKKLDVLNYLSSDNDEASGIYQQHQPHHHQPNPINVFAFQSDWSEDEDDLNSPVKPHHEDLLAQYESATDSHAEDSHAESAAEEVHHDNYLSESGRSEMADTLPMDIHPKRSWLSHPVGPPSHTDFAIDDNPTPMPGHFLNSDTFPLTTSSPLSSPNSSFSASNSMSASQASTAPTEASLSPELSKSSPLSREKEEETLQETPTRKPIIEEDRVEPPQDAATAKLEAQMRAAKTHRRNSAGRRSSIRSEHGDRPRMQRMHSAQHMPAPFDHYAPPSPHAQQPVYPPYGVPPPAAAYYQPPPPPTFAAPPLHDGIPAESIPPPPLQISDTAHLSTASIPSSPERKTVKLHKRRSSHSHSHKHSHSKSSAYADPSSSTGTGVHKYRAFTTLQHRLLSSLQSEIAALEGQLDTLDAQLNELNTHLAGAGAGNGALVSSTSELHWRRSQLVEHIAGKLKIYNAVRDDMSKSQPHSPSEEKKEPEMPEVVKAQLKMIEDMTEKVQEAQRTMLRLTGAEPEEVTVVVKETREEKMRREMRVAAVLASLLVPLLIFPFIRNFGGRVVVACFVGAFCWGKMGWEEVVMEEGAHGGKDGKSDEDRHERMKRRHSRSEKHVAEDKTWEAYTPVIGAGAWGLTMLLMAGIVR